MTDLALLFEHPLWFLPLFDALERRGVDHVALRPDGYFDPADRAPPARVVFNRIAMSSFLRADEHPIFHAMALLDHWRRAGARVINGPEVLAIDSSKARQLSLIAGLGLAIPETRVVHRVADVEAAAATLPFPLVVKANIGGSGAGSCVTTIWPSSAPRSPTASCRPVSMACCSCRTMSRPETARSRGSKRSTANISTRSTSTGAGAFDLCPADACQIPGAPIPMVSADPAPEPAPRAEAIAGAAGLDVGGIEVMIDDRDGVPRFYDINALSNFVAKPLDVLGWDPHDRLVDYLIHIIGEARG